MYLTSPLLRSFLVLSGCLQGDKGKADVAGKLPQQLSLTPVRTGRSAPHAAGQLTLLDAIEKQSLASLHDAMLRDL